MHCHEHQGPFGVVAPGRPTPQHGTLHDVIKRTIYLRIIAN